MIIPRVFALVGLLHGFERADRQLLDAAALAAYLALCRSVQLLVLLARGDAAKDLEILVLRVVGGGR